MHDDRDPRRTILDTAVGQAYPMTAEAASVVPRHDDHAQLRAVVDRVAQELAATTAEVETLRRERARLSDRADTAFVAGYDQAVGEIRDHFARAGHSHVVAIIGGIWGKDGTS